MVYLGGITKVKDVLILGLRAFFANPDNYQHLLPKQLNSNTFATMKIYDGSPTELRSFPLMVIGGSSGRMVTAGISGDFASEVYDDTGDVKGYLYGGMYEFSVEVEIGTKTTLEREVLMDITASALRFSLRRRMEYHGIIIKETSYGGENKIQYDSDFIYVSSINLQIYSEWYDYFSLLPLTDIKVNGKLQDYKEYVNRYKRKPILSDQNIDRNNIKISYARPTPDNHVNN